SLFFFYSSRRRHTSFSRDWSSDVCSSDLVGQDIVVERFAETCGIAQGQSVGEVVLYFKCADIGARLAVIAVIHAVEGVPAHVQRSEERRVGKEGSYRWERSHGRTKRRSDH